MFAYSDKCFKKFLCWENGVLHGDCGVMRCGGDWCCLGDEVGVFGGGCWWRFLLEATSVIRVHTLCR